MGTLVCNDPGKPPQLVMLRPTQLVINEEYQRELSKASKAAIKRMAHEFDWAAYKALSAAPTDNPNMYEVVDGQHTAIAAITNGRVPYLPCLLHETSVTLKDKAQGFIGINTKRIALTPMAIFNAKVAAQDEDAIAVECAMARAGVTLLELPPANRNKWNVGETMAVGSMMNVVARNGDTRLSAILRIAVLAKAAPVSALLIKALDLCVPLDHASHNGVIVEALTRQVIPRLEAISASETPTGRRTFETMADKIADAAGIPRRLGRPKAKPGRPRTHER